MPPPPLPVLFCSEQDIQDLMSVLGEQARLDDLDTGAGGLTVESARALQKAQSYATTRVLFYAVQRYDATALASSWLVNEWSTVIACHWLCCRRANGVPDSLHELMYGDGKATNRGVMGDLADIRAERAIIPDVGTRNVPWFSWSNVRVDPRYRVRQVRVERPLSERTATQYPQNVDWPSEGASEV